MAFTASSGNQAVFSVKKAFDFEQNEQRSAVEIHWKTTPSLTDMQEFDAWFGTQNPDIIYAGSVRIDDDDERRKKMRKFLATGDYPA